MGESEVGQKGGRIPFAGLVHYRELDKEPFKAEIQGMSVDPVELRRGEGSIEVRIRLRNGRGVLGHQAEGEPGAEFKKKGCQGIP